MSRNEAARAARALWRRARSGSLATALASEGGRPYASLVTVVADVDGSPVFLFSGLSEHTRNLAADQRAALLVEAASGRANPQTGPRLSLLGTIAPEEGERLRRRFLARHPEAGRYADFADFGTFRMAVERVHWVGGFAAARWLAAEAVLTDAAGAAAIAAAEPAVLAHMNADHGEVIDLYANRLLGRRGQGWQMVAVDPDGCDLRRRSTAARLDFPDRVDSAGALREMLTELARRARN